MNVIVSNDPTNIAASEMLNAQYWLSKLANSRTPIARFVGEGDVPNPPAPAWYIPQTGDIYIHADDADINVRKLTEDMDGFDGAKTMGLLGHEAAHAAISEGMTVVEVAVPHHSALLTTIEEVRVENHVIRRVPHLRSALRASFTIVLNGIRDLDTTQPATVARAWALVMGRTLAGIATAAETKPIDTAARTLLEDDTVDALTDLLQEALTLNLDYPRDVRRMIEICDEWVELVGEETGTGDDSCDAEDADGSGAKGKGKSGKGKSGKGKGGGKGDGGEKAESDDDESGGGKGDESDGDEEGDDDEGSGGGDAGDGDEDEGDDEGDYDTGTPDAVDSFYGEYDPGTEGKELTDALLKDLAERMAEEWDTPPPVDGRTPAMVAASKVFGNKRESTRLYRKDPTVEQRQAVLEVANVLSNLALPAVSKVSVSSQLPPGRLRSREAVRASAERAQGRMISAEPWRGTKRRHSTARPLIVGIATDTSGSMKWAQQAVADFAYVWANAGHRIGARTAAVTFGDRVYPIARPGIILNQVVGKEANDATEECDYALAALDGVLHLSTPSYAARILVVVSDGALVKHGEEQKVQRWLEDFTKVGTHVLWVGSPAARWSSGWVGAMAKYNPNLTIVMPDGERGRRLGFEAINSQVLDAVKHDIR